MGDRLRVTEVEGWEEVVRKLYREEGEGGNQGEVSKTRGSNTGRGEEMGGMAVKRERDKGAGGQVRQQELRGDSHYDSFSCPQALTTTSKPPAEPRDQGDHGRQL